MMVFSSCPLVPNFLHRPEGWRIRQACKRRRIVLMHSREWRESLSLVTGPVSRRLLLLSTAAVSSFVKPQYLGAATLDARLDDLLCSSIIYEIWVDSTSKASPCINQLS